MLPIDFVQNMTPLTISQVVGFMKIKDKPRFKTSWVLKNEIKAVDLYCYLGARFGAPNGVQNIVRSDSSDNLVHWEWMIKSKTRFIIIHGLNYRSEVWITGEKFTDAEKNELIVQLRADFQSHGEKMGKIRNILEHWTEFINPYKRVRNSVLKLLSEINALKLDATTDKVPEITDNINLKTIEKIWIEQATKYSRALGFSFGVRSMLPVMAEAFVNLILHNLMKPELAKDTRLREAIIRSPIDVRIKSLSNNCHGFKQQIDYSIQACKDYHSLVNDRNDLLHGNIVIDKLKFNDLYFHGKVPLFKNYSSMWERAFGIEQQFVGLDVINNELKIVDSLTEYLLSCLVDQVREQVEYVAGQLFLAVNSENGRLGVLFPEWLVDMGTLPIDS